MVKVNSHPYEGQTVYLGTKHGKQAALEPHFEKIKMRCLTIAVDTDQFGTFTGEVERTGTVKETLRRKANEVGKSVPAARFVLASEGSFGPHPHLGFVHCDHEVLLFFDRQTGLEIFADELSTETNHDETELGPNDDFQKCLARLKFPSHGLIVRPKGRPADIYKGITDVRELDRAISECFRLSEVSKVILSTDMRASFNPTRMSVIGQAGQKLLERLTSFCPSCSSPGFGAAERIRGLPCSECGAATRATKAVIHRCPRCQACESYAVEARFIDPSECDFCNP